nr:7906_t:CDS:2 [Entrophospora candida]
MLLFDSERKQKHQVRYTEFQAIVLAGYGNRLYPLTEDNNVPKALLPIANKPMLYYVLDWLERAGIFDVIIITESNGEYKIGQYIKNVYEGKLKPILEVVKEDVGTADNDFIIISCDLILDLPPHQLLDYHRKHNPTFTALYSEPKKSEGVTGGSGGSSGCKDDVKQFVGVDVTKSRLVYLASSADLDEELSVRMSLLWKFPRLNILTKLQDSHLYIFKRWVIDLIVNKKSISSIREQLIPLLVKCQYQKKLIDKEGINEFAKTQDSQKMTKIRTETRVSQSAVISPKTQVGSDSLVGDDTKIDDRTSIKRSTIGTHCVIGKNVKISNSVIMDHVIIEDK